MKGFLRGRINNSVFGDFSKIHRRNLKKIGQFFPVAIRFHPSHPQTIIIDTSFGALVRLFFYRIEPLFQRFH